MPGSRGRKFDAIAGKFEPKPEAVRIGAAGVGACPRFDGQVLLEEAVMYGARRILAGLEQSEFQSC
jgi:isoaspartyl peptidase/L-asparaginase-like protein (Ntn-hydrolase superfamily)